MNTDLSVLPAGVLAVLGILLAAALSLDAVALVDLYRRPAEGIALGRKWIWVAVILLLNLLGPVLYFLAGRKPSAAEATADRHAPHRHIGGAETANELYGPPDQPLQQ
ncbi:PLDc N-terminal domain-containing protein [Arthrobacter sp. AD-310]